MWSTCVAFLQPGLPVKQKICAQKVAAYNERIKDNCIRFNQDPDKVDTGIYSIIYPEPAKRKKKRLRFECFLLITCTIVGRPSTFSRSVILNFMSQQLQASI